jgi:hypothetical protein
MPVRKSLKSTSTGFLNRVSGVRVAPGVFLIMIMLLHLIFCRNHNTKIIAKLKRCSGGGKEGKAQFSVFFSW